MSKAKVVFLLHIFSVVLGEHLFEGQKENLKICVTYTNATV